MAEVKTPPTSATAFLDEEKQLTAIRTFCAQHLNITPDERLPADCKELVRRDELVSRWAANRQKWNMEIGGMTLAELWFVTECFQFLARNGVADELTLLLESDCIRMCDALRQQCSTPTDDRDLLFSEIAFAVVALLSHGMDKAVDLATEQTLAARVKQAAAPPDADRLATMKIECETTAGRAVLELVPLAARFYWHIWAEDMVTRGAEEFKFSVADELKFDKWLGMQFKIMTQQQFLIDFSELVYRDAIPTGGHLFSQRGNETAQDQLPSVGVAQIELTEAEQKSIITSMGASIADISSDPNNRSRGILEAHMFCYTFDNMLQTSARRMPFAPFLVWKSELPSRFVELTTEKIKWGRVKRPIIVQTHRGFFVRCAECACSSTSIALEHIDSSRSCVLKMCVWECPTIKQALVCWLTLMRREFKCQLACGTKVDSLVNECLAH